MVRGHGLVWFDFPYCKCFQLICLSCPRICKHSRNSKFVHKKTISTICVTKRRSNSLQCCSRQFCGTNVLIWAQKVKAMDYYKLLYPCIWPGAPKCPQDAIFQHDGAPHIPRAVRSPLYDMFSNSYTGSFDPRDCPGRLPYLASHYIFFWEFIKINYIGLLSQNLWHYYQEYQQQSDTSARRFLPKCG